MNALTRRSFLTKTATTATGLALAGSAWAQPTGSNDDIRIGIVGMGNKGDAHLRILSELSGVRVVALCDVDQIHLDEAAQIARELGQRVKPYRDVRNLLEDKEIDAVIFASPNHWHALMTIWALQAGKDIYVEKPVSHDIWEAHRLMEAHQKYGRIIQVGTQNRSNPGFIEGVEYLRSGALGKLLWIHGVFFKLRRSLGHRRGPQRIPSTVDYDLFQGPAPMQPLMRNELHYNWHWQWDTGNGDMGNNAAHTVDNLRHIMGDDRQPERVMSLGGRFTYCDDGETPNVHLAYLDYGDVPVFAEIRGIAYRPGADFVDHIRGSRQNAIVQCEGGYLLMGPDALAYTNDGKRIRDFGGTGGVKEHMVNFLDAVRNQDASILNCPLKIGVQAADIFHTAILSYRSGFPATTEQVWDALGREEPGKHAVESILENLGRHEIDLEKNPLTLGSWMSLEDSGSTLKVQNPESNLVAQGLFQKRQYRAPYVIPDKF